MKNMLSCQCFDKWRECAPLILRVAAGAIFFAHGWQKMFVFTPSGFADALTNMGFPAVMILSYFIIILELVGGAALILGLFTHWVGKLFAIEMLVALLFVHLKAGFFVSNNGLEFVLALFAMSLSVAILGAGKWSLDGMMRSKQSARPGNMGNSAQGGVSGMS